MIEWVELSRDDGVIDSHARLTLMSKRPIGALDAVAQKWRQLAERRRVHFIELFHSGRWKHYYTEEAFLTRMREVIRASERWALIAPPAAENVPAVAEVAPDEAALAESAVERDAA